MNKRNFKSLLGAKQRARLRRLSGLASALALAGIATSRTVAAEATLTGRAVLPLATYAEGPSSGHYLGASVVNGVSVPTAKQPVQGFSAALRNADGTLNVMPDNGYGSMENSADFRLRVYTLNPDFKTKDGGSGSVGVQSFIELRDPDNRIPFAITENFTADRFLTGADFDVESMQRAPDGTLWFGDEFGPFLLHTDATGKVLEAPIQLPDADNPGKFIRSPQNPMSEESSAVRIMNAVRNHAQNHGNSRTPVFSPWFVMLDDANADTFIDNRLAPPAGSGLAPASSDIFNVASIQSAGYPVVTWTVNDKVNMTKLMKLKVNGVISDRPDLLLQAVREFDGDGDGKPDFLDADGLIDIAKFDAQGHRGGRNLRPENTLPAMEVALDNLMTTLETDCGVTSDGVPILSHDPYVEAAKVRKADGTPYAEADQVLIKNMTAAQIQATFVNDKLFRGPTQINDLSASPVSVAFASSKGLLNPYVMPTLQQLFEFVDFYVAYYTSGAGAAEPDAALRAKNAARVHFNIETKVNPRTDADPLGNVFKARTIAAEPFAKTVADVIVANHKESVADIQSFDFSTLLVVQEQYPAIRTVYLFGDFPLFADQTLPGNDDGTNLQPQGGANTPWLAGLYWPYRSTKLSNSFRAARSGGLEGMALTPDGRRLLPLIEKPLVGGEAGTDYILEFDLVKHAFTGNRYKYLLDRRGTSIGDFQLFEDGRGLIIERDESQGDLNGFKRVYEVKLNGNNNYVSKRLAVDLLRIQDPNNISAGGLAGDVGLGAEFAFPFQTIEDIIPLDSTHLLLINDNNFPFSIGRHFGAKIPDDNEIITLELAEPLGTEMTTPSSTVEPYYPKASPAGSTSGYTTESFALLTTGDPGVPSINGYRFAGIPDGLGAFDNGNGTFTLLVNHELRGGDLPGGGGRTNFTTNAVTGVVTASVNSALGVVRAYGGKGAFVSKWIINKADLNVLSGEDLIKTLHVYENGAYRLFNPATDFHFSRFCSADLPLVSAFYNAATGLGAQERIFMNGEEDERSGGYGGRAFAHIVTGPQAGHSYDLPWLGRFSWENAVANPLAQDKTIVMGTDDGELTNSQVYTYIGMKQSDGLEIDKAGLTKGDLFGLRVDVNGSYVQFESNDKVLGLAERVTRARFTLVKVDDAAHMNGEELNKFSTNSMTNFKRAEDGAWDPNHPADFYFVTTGRVESSATSANLHNVTDATRLWRVRFDDITDPTLGGTIEMLVEGPAGIKNGLSDTQPVMLDNVGFLKNGKLMLQEDPGNYDRLAKTWLYDPATGALSELTSASPRVFQTGGAAFETRDEESSGAIDMSDILGEGWVLYDVQNHRSLGGELVEGGQLVAMKITKTPTTSPSTKVEPYYVPSAAAAAGGYNVSVVSMITVDDAGMPTIGGYKMAGIPDGLGILPHDDGKFSLFMNHELRGGDLPGGNGTPVYTTNTTTGVITTNFNSAQGIVRAHGGKGAFVSEWVVNASNLQALSGSDLIKSVFLYNNGGGYRPFDPATDYHFSRFCSADLPKVSAFYNAATGKGTTTRFFLNGEEDGGAFRLLDGRAFAHTVTGPDKGKSYELAWLGKFNWENALANPFPQDLTVVIGNEDADLNNSQVYVYVGEKKTAGLDIEKAGLTHGSLSAIRVEDEGQYVPAESNDKVLGLTTRKTKARFGLAEYGDVSQLTGKQLDTLSVATSTSFQRVEDGAWNPLRPNEYYFVTTGRVENGATRPTFNDITNADRLWRVTFDDITHPEWGGWIELALEGPVGPGLGLSDLAPVMVDNICFTPDGKLLLQEDPGNYARLAKIWIFDPVTRQLTELLAASPRYFKTGAAEFHTLDEESSGIIDASEVLGEGWYLLAVQDHSKASAEAVEKGQLIAMHIEPTPAFPTFQVQPVSQTLTVGQTMTTRAQVTGTGPFTYQWFWNGVAIQGATAAEITLYNFEVVQSGGKLTVEVSGPEGKITSQAALIKVNPPGAKLSLQMIPGLVVEGIVGANYRIEYREAFAPADQWVPLTTLALPQSPFQYLDMSGVGKAARFYRVVLP